MWNHIIFLGRFGRLEEKWPLSSLVFCVPSHILFRQNICQSKCENKKVGEASGGKLHLIIALSYVGIKNDSCVNDMYLNTVQGIFASFTNTHNKVKQSFGILNLACKHILDRHCTSDMSIRHLTGALFKKLMWSMFSPCDLSMMSPE